MENIFVIGNGESRKDFDLKKLRKILPKKQNLIIGCNALHRDFKPDILVCTDRNMVSETIEHRYDKPVYTRERWNKYKEDNILSIPVIPFPQETDNKFDDQMNWGSGTNAVYIACTKEPKNIYLIGFDLYSTEEKFNNVYKDTLNYKKANEKSVNPIHWIYQLNKLFEHYTNTKFFQIQQRGWKSPEGWEENKNYKKATYKKLENLLEKK